jgi:hypothetical protein
MNLLEAQQINLHDRFFGLKRIGITTTFLNYNAPESYKTPIIPIINKNPEVKI